MSIRQAVTLAGDDWLRRIESHPVHFAHLKNAPACRDAEYMKTAEAMRRLHSSSKPEYPRRPAPRARYLEWRNLAAMK